MKQEISNLVREGLYHENLLKIIKLCRASFNERPSLYGALAFILRSLAEEYDGQAITVERYEMIMNTLQQPILAVLDAQDGPSEVFLKNFDEVFKRFDALEPYHGIRA